ncbi:hypothetical protein [Nocardiopsis lambiniae]|uniref:Uncharacterized protein n=1 Tax=Nocardiopsis lambiniae TaxID=3075539 RepID=A0ABU2M3H7_9ACTN|nr:hypothetical protein [Nocardiopsis sp. DSM 44743]MDT0327144.1 hypothetical protein [Nocardiopsis sp. DSM 44743]
MSETQTPDRLRPDIVELVLEAFARVDITAERRSPTLVLIHLPGAEPFTKDFSDAVEQARSYPVEQYPDMAEQVALAMMRAFRERDIPLGTHYPPRSDDHGRAALVAVLRQLGLDARFETPKVLSLPLSDGQRVTSDVSDYLATVEGVPIDDAFDKAGPFAKAVADQIRRIVPQDESSEARWRVRLYPTTAFPEEVWDALLFREFAPGLRETVVIDTPESVQPLDRSVLERMGRTEEQVHTEAIARSVAEEVEASEVELGGVAIIHIGGAQPYTSAQAHVLSRHLGEAPHGALVAFPVPQVILANPLGKGDPIMAMDRLQELAERFVSDADRPISAQLFWWHPDSAARAEGGVPDLRPVGVEIDHEERSVSLYTSDEEFGPMLDGLTGQG